MLNNFPPMELGETLSGKDDANNNIHNDKLGLVYEFPVGGGDKKTRPTGKTIKAVLLRNESGLTLLGKRLAVLTKTAGYTPAESVDGYAASLAVGGVVLIDPNLDSNGVADDDIFWGLIGGPAEVLLPLTGAGFNGDIAVGNPLVAATGTTSGATTAGRVSNITLPGTTGATQAFSMAFNCIGRALSARTTAESTAGNTILVDLAIRLGW